MIFLRRLLYVTLQMSFKIYCISHIFNSASSGTCLSLHYISLYPSPAVFPAFFGRSQRAVQQSGEFQQAALLSVTFLAMAISILCIVS